MSGPASFVLAPTVQALYFASLDVIHNESWPDQLARWRSATARCRLEILAGPACLRKLAKLLDPGPSSAVSVTALSKADDILRRIPASGPPNVAADEFLRSAILHLIANGEIRDFAASTDLSRESAALSAAFSTLCSTLNGMTESERQRLANAGRSLLQEVAADSQPRANRTAA